MSHHHYADVIDPKTGETYEETQNKKKMVHHYDDGPDIVATNKRIKEIEDEKKRLDKEKQSIIEKEEVKNKEAKKLSDQLQKLKEAQHKTELAIIETREKLYKLCTHEKVRTEHRNYPGGYLDREEYWTDYYCELCGQKIDEKVKYGGFG